MDDVNHSTRSKRVRVLRAADVLPPFDKVPAPGTSGEGETIRTEGNKKAGTVEGKNTSNAADRPLGPFGPSTCSPTASRTDTDVELSPAICPEIPKYDLAENILAEQRRTAARRRRAPGEEKATDKAGLRGRTPGKATENDGDGQTCRSSGLGTIVPSLSRTGEGPVGDLAEIQRIVAEIVARDIERLCRRPERQPRLY